MRYVAIIKLPPITKKNSQQIVTNRATGRPFIIPSKQYRDYEQESGYFLHRPLEPINEPVCVKCIYYMPTHRKVDLTNLMEATHDILVKYGVLEDDNSEIIVSVDGSRVEYDKENPRTEIYISEVIDNE